MSIQRTKIIPVFELKTLAEHFGYDQIILVARRVGDDGAEYVNSYGTNIEHSRIAQHAAERIKREYLQWPAR